jgi:putative oxidoreductase
MDISLQKPNTVDGAYAQDYHKLQPRVVPQWLAVIAIVLTLGCALYSGWVLKTLPDVAAWSAPALLLIALLSALWLTPRVFVPGSLITLLPFLIAWRVAVMNDATLVVWSASLTAAVLLGQFIDCLITDWRRNRGVPGAWLGTLVWQATLVRMYFGLNEVGHSTEKLFAGLDSFHHLVGIFQGLGLGGIAPVFVILAGLTELFSALSVGLGFLARLGALVSVGYFLVATVGFGGEWARGYAWAAPGGGGWEYVMMLLVVFGSVLLTGAGKFSIDGWLLRTNRLPRWLKPAATNEAGLTRD